MPQYELPPDISRMIVEMRRDIQMLKSRVGKAAIPLTVVIFGNDGLEDITTIAYAPTHRLSGKAQNRQISVEVRVQSTTATVIGARLVHEETGLVLNGAVNTNMGDGYYTLVGDLDVAPGTIVHIQLQARRQSGFGADPSIKVVNAFGQGAL